MAVEEITELINEAVTGEVFGVWFLIGAALVFFMQAGFAMVETGFTRAKNAGNIIMKNLMDFCIGTAVFILLGFSLMMAEDYAFGFIGIPALYSIWYSAPRRLRLYPVPWRRGQSLYPIVFTQE